MTDGSAFKESARAFKPEQRGHFGVTELAEYGARVAEMTRKAIAETENTCVICNGSLIPSDIVPHCEDCSVCDEEAPLWPTDAEINARLVKELEATR